MTPCEYQKTLLVTLNDEVVPADKSIPKGEWLLEAAGKLGSF